MSYTGTMTKKVARLFEQFAPERYTLELDIDDQNLTFNGKVTVLGKTKGRPRQRITLHQKDLTVVSAEIVHIDKKGNRKKLTVDRINTHNSYDEVRLHTAEQIFPGKAEVTLEFKGNISDAMHGIYPCYFNHDGQEKKLIATQFESHHAREAFPCIDEPEAKAVFDLTLKTNDSQPIVLGNQPVKSATKEGSKTVTTFESSPIMSSYLLAFVTGEMHYKKAKTKSGVDIKTWATVNHPLDTLGYALDVSVKCVEFFEDYFGVAYPLPKLDHVALPDFSVGAMENWGLITYRERLLIEYPGVTGQSTREHIALVIAHETSHQWFGNLVTMKWWDDLWLNESFANMMEYEAIDAVFPEWDIWETFISAEGLSAIRRDAIKGVQSVKTDVNHPDEIHTLFDPSIVYAKGGRLLYMLKNYVGEKAFRQGLSDYFKTHAYGNTTGDDLWQAISAASGKDIGNFMNKWLLRPGFPIVSLSESDDKKLHISQKAFSYDPAHDSKNIWPTPLFAADNSLPKLLETKELIVDKPASLLINQGNIGHYIVNYASEAVLNEIINLLKSNELSSNDSLGLINSQAMLAKAGISSYTRVLDIADGLQHETNESVWDVTSLIIAELNRFIELDETLEKPIKLFVDKLTQIQVERLGWQEQPDESTRDRKLRGIILSLSSFSENKQTKAQAVKLFESFKNDSAAIPAELRSIVFGSVIRFKHKDAFPYLLDLHHKTDNGDLKADIASGLCNTIDRSEVEIIFETIVDKKLVKPQDADRWIYSLVRGRRTKDQAWQWIQNNWSWVVDTYGSDKTFDYMPRVIASTVNTPTMFTSYKAHFTPLKDASLVRNTEIGIDEITTRLQWLDRDLPNIQHYFKS